MGDAGEDMGRIKKAVETLEGNSEKHFESNERRRKENQETRLKVDLIRRTVEETNQNVLAMAQGMDDIKKSLIQIRESQTHTEARIDILEARIDNSIEKQFDWSKFMAGVDNVVRMKLFWVTIIVLSTLTFLWNRPEFLPVLVDLFNITKFAK